MLDLLAIGMVIPVLPQLIRQVGHLSERDLILTVGGFGTVWATMQLLAAPVGLRWTGLAHLAPWSTESSAFVGVILLTASNLTMP